MFGERWQWRHQHPSFKNTDVPAQVIEEMNTFLEEMRRAEKEETVDEDEGASYKQGNEQDRGIARIFRQIDVWHGRIFVNVHGLMLIEIATYRHNHKPLNMFTIYISIFTVLLIIVAKGQRV